MFLQIYIVNTCIIQYFTFKGFTNIYIFNTCSMFYSATVCPSAACDQIMNKLLKIKVSTLRK